LSPLRSFAEEILQQSLGRVEDLLRRIGGHREHRWRRIWLRTARPTARDRELIRAIIAATAEPIRAAERAGDRPKRHFGQVLRRLREAHNVGLRRIRCIDARLRMLDRPADDQRRGDAGIGEPR
jgi:hypothetical protein